VGERIASDRAPAGYAVVPRLITVRRAAELLALSPRQVYRLLALGDVEGVRIRGSVRVVAESVRDLVARGME